jgi:hypothetical protein
LDCPREAFLTLRLLLPRGVVRFAFGVAFLRAVRLAFLRSSLERVLVFAMFVLGLQDDYESKSIEVALKNLGEIADTDMSIPALTRPGTLARTPLPKSFATVACRIVEEHAFRRASQILIYNSGL